MKIITTLLFISVACGVQLSIAQCVPGPPTYGCSSSNQNAIVQNDSPTPNMGGATGVNTLLTPADFNNPIVRCTDQNSGSGYGFTGSWTVTPTGANFDNIVNKDSSLIVVTFSNTGTYGVVGFNATTQQCNTTLVPGFKISGGSFTWSRTVRGRLYHLNGTKVEFYLFTDGVTPPTGPTTLFDFATCPNTPISGSITWQGALGVNLNDTAIAGSASTHVGGGQDYAQYALYYTVIGGTGYCAIYNTGTGQITGTIGVGTATDTATYNIHDAYFGSGGYLDLSYGSCISGDCLVGTNHHYFWQAGTTNVFHSSNADHGSGHSVPGYNLWFNSDAFPKVYTRNFNAPASPTLWPGSYPSPCCSVNETHYSWNYTNSTDTRIVLGSAVNTTLGSSPTFTTPLQNEIFGYMMDGSFTWRRFGHCYNTGTSSNFYVSNCITSISQDGKWAVFSSDWLGTLGGRVGDVFVLRLR